MKCKWNKWLSDIDGVVDICTSAMNEIKPETNNGTSYRDIARKWFTEMPIHAYSKSHFDHKDGYQIQLSEIRNIFSHRYSRTKYWHKWFEKNYPIWTVLQKGNTYKGNTRIMIHPTHDQILSVASPDEIGRVFEKEIEAGQPQQDIDIDVENLERFIRVCEYNMVRQKYKGSGWVNKIKENQTQARKLVKLAEYYDQPQVNPLTGDTRYVIPQPYKTSPFGRRYYTGGFALQNKNAQVRIAALGRCWGIDIDSSVFRFYKGLATDFNIEHSTLDILLADKRAFRAELSGCLQNIPQKLDYLNNLVKQSITAMGFGARDTSYWDPDKARMVGALSEIIKNRDDRDRLTQHPYWRDLKRIYNEIKAATLKDKDLVNSVKTNETYWQRNKYTGDRLMSLLYQHYEANVMERCIELLEECQREPRLWVHDGVYTLMNPQGNAGYFAAVEKILQEEFNPFIKFEITKHDEYTVQYTEEIQKEETEHTKNLAVEEMLARQWAYDNQFNRVLTPEEKLAGIRKRNPEYVENSTGEVDSEMPSGYYSDYSQDGAYIDAYYEENPFDPDE